MDDTRFLEQFEDTQFFVLFMCSFTVAAYRQFSRNTTVRQRLLRRVRDLQATSVQHIVVSFAGHRFLHPLISGWTAPFKEGIVILEQVPAGRPRIGPCSCGFRRLTRQLLRDFTPPLLVDAFLLKPTDCRMDESSRSPWAKHCSHLISGDSHRLRRLFLRFLSMDLMAAWVVLHIGTGVQQPAVWNAGCYATDGCTHVLDIT